MTFKRGQRIYVLDYEAAGPANVVAVAEVTYLRIWSPGPVRALLVTDGACEWVEWASDTYCTREAAESAAREYAARCGCNVLGV